MKILFLNFNLGATVGIHQGLISLSSMLKRNGHQVNQLLLNEEIGMDFHLGKIKQYILKNNPDIIGISIIELQLKYIKTFCSHAKTYFNGKIICGGSYAGMSPEDTLNITGVDAVCVGEGEEALCEYCLDFNRTDIKNIWVKKKNSNKIIKNPLRPFRCLDFDGEMDYRLFNLNKILPAKNYQLQVMAGRGCVNKCSYCINGAYVEKYKKYCEKPIHLKEYIRARRIDDIICEIKLLKINYCIKKIAFIDDNFLIYPNFLKSFCERYKKEINLPFDCLASPVSLTKEKAKILKDAGCDTVRMGVESGSDRIKKEILNRPILNSAIINAFSIARDTGLKTSSFNMIGLPTETAEEVVSTLELNTILEPDYIKLVTFYPFSNTPIYDYCVKHKLINNKLKKGLSNYNSYTCLKFSKVHTEFLTNVQNDFIDMFNCRMSLKNKCFRYKKIANSVIEKEMI